MTAMPLHPAAIDQTSPQELHLSGFWTAFGLGAIKEHRAHDRIAAKFATAAQSRTIGGR